MPEKVTMDSARLYRYAGKIDAYTQVLARVNSILDANIDDLDELYDEVDALRGWLEAKETLLIKEMQGGKT